MIQDHALALSKAIVRLGDERVIFQHDYWLLSNAGVRTVSGIVKTVPKSAHKKKVNIMWVSKPTPQFVGLIDTVKRVKCIFFAHLEAKTACWSFPSLSLSELFKYSPQQDWLRLVRTTGLLSISS